MQFKIKKEHKLQEIYIFNNDYPNPVKINNVFSKTNQNVEVLIFIVLDKDTKLVLDTRSIIDAKSVTAFTRIKAVLKDSAKLEHTGLIKIGKSGNLANAYLSSKVLLLGDSLTAFSKPQLEIEANEVKASHGSSIGRLSEEELFYLKTRGLSEQQAEKLTVEGFFEEQIEKIEDMKIREKVRKLIYQPINLIT